MSRFRYTKEHLDFLRRAYLKMKVQDVTKAFNGRFGLDKTDVMIKAALQNHNITCGRKGSERLIRQRRWYTDEHERFVRRHCADMRKKDLVKLFNKRFGMNMTVSKMKAFFANREINSGRTGYFPKGNKPWNHGTKGQGLTGANSGSFKKGSVPPNQKPLWSERIDSKDGYVLMKVPEEDPYTGFPTRYKHKHVWVYEQKHGPVPDGHVVIFRDGDKRKFDPGNLMMITRAVHARLNQDGYKDAPEKVKPSILARSLLQTKIGEIQRQGVRKEIED